MSVRLRRLKADYDKLSTIFTQNSRIRIKKTFGSPPEKYQVEYLVSGLEKHLDGKLQLRNNFMVEITLTGAYPRMAPQCKMLTPVYHPNIAPHAVCIGDHWAAGESLANLVVRIAEMLSYQSYNIKSPLNGDAAKWSQENQDRLPLDTFDFTSLLSIGEAVSRNQDGTSVAGGVCANCGKQAVADEMKVCSSSHVACPECVMDCPVCHKPVCLKCNLVTCSTCKKAVCSACGYRCASCGQTACTEHAGACGVCNTGRCSDCLVECAECQRPTCLDHISKRGLTDGTSAFFCSTCLAKYEAPAPRPSGEQVT